MQGQKGTIGSLPETLSLEHGSTSSDSTVVDQPISWTNFMLHPPVNTYQDSQNVNLWSTNESSSSSVPTQPTTEHGWSSLLKLCPDPHQHEPHPSPLTLGDVHMNSTHNHHHHHHHDVAPHNATVHPSTSTFIDFKPSNYASSSSAPFEMANRQLPCKRKATELGIGQSSSGIECSNIFQTPDNHAETNRRNVRVRINNHRRQQSLPAGGVNNGQINISSSHPSLELNPVIMRTPSVGNLSTQVGRPVLRVPSLRRNLQILSRNSSSSTRASRSSNTVNGPMPMNISDHPLFVQQPNEIRNTSTAINWSLSNNDAGSISNTVPAASSPAQPSVGPHRESGASVVGGGQNGNLFAGLPPPVRSLHEAGNVPPVFGLHRHHLVHARSADRQHRAAYGFPISARAAGSEGRGRLMSEIRNVLDLLRRGEGLRIEDVMLLDQSVLYGMVDIQDRHRDMRLDIDNMSYEELLALEERIGNVNTGLTEENIFSCLKRKAYVAVSGQPDTEPCCVCQEEYKNGDDLGSLKCGHDFHTNCIKQWLLQKNSCPVCKSSASATNK